MVDRRLLGVVVAGLLVLTLAVPTGVVTRESGSDGPERTATDVKYVSLSAESPAVVRGSPAPSPGIWPFTSRRRTFDSLTLPVNVVVHGEPTRVRRLLTDGSDEWESETRRPVGVRYRPTHGATRYTYVPDAGWKTETAQLHDGTYLGARLHARLYTVDESWTAIQVHREYWDPFRLRHTVTTVQRAQHELEREFVGRRATRDVSRERFANGGALDADGWASVVELAPRTGVTESPSGDTAASNDAVPTSSEERHTVGIGPLLIGSVLLTAGGLVSRRRLDVVRQYRRLIALGGGLALVPLVVRIGSVTLERLLPTVHPKVFAAAGFLVLAVGVPVWAVRIADARAPSFTGMVAGVGFGFGLLLDLQWLAVSTLAVDVVLHRLFVVFGVALFAAAGSHAARRDDAGDGWLHTHALTVASVGVWSWAFCWSLFVGL